MSSVEGRGDGMYNATFFEVKSAPATWDQVDFEDYLGENFTSEHIRLKVTGLTAVQFTFDPRAIPGLDVHGELATGEVIELPNKRADSIRVKSTGAPSNIQIYAWR